MCTYGTVWRAAITRGRLAEGETILVTGASGGVGSAMVQIAKAMVNSEKKFFCLFSYLLFYFFFFFFPLFNIFETVFLYTGQNCKILAVTSSESKVDYIKKLGADHVIISSDGKFHNDPIFKTIKVYLFISIR